MVKYLSTKLTAIRGPLSRRSSMSPEHTYAMASTKSSLPETKHNAVEFLVSHLFCELKLCPHWSDLRRSIATKTATR